MACAGSPSRCDGGAGAIAGDAVADAVDATELLGVDVEQLAGAGALVTDHSRSRLEGGEAAEAEAAEHRPTVATGARAACDLRAGQALPAQALDLAMTSGAAGGAIGRAPSCDRGGRARRPPATAPAIEAVRTDTPAARAASSTANDGCEPAPPEGVDHGPSCAHSCGRSSEAPGPAVQASQPQLYPQASDEQPP